MGIAGNVAAGSLHTLANGWRPDLSEAQHLTRFGSLLAGSEIFAVPALHYAHCTLRELVMDFMGSAPQDSLDDAPQTVRDRVATALIDLLLRELIVFGTMQPTAPDLAADFRALAPVALYGGALYGGALETRNAILRIASSGPATGPHHLDLIQSMFSAAMAPLRQDRPFDFAANDLLKRLPRPCFCIARLTVSI